MTKTTTLLAALLLTITTTISAQDTKGALPANSQQPTANGQTRAVVIGISDYQDAAIPDLHFAHRDAEAFANFLRSPAGGSLDGDHLKVLTNVQATAGRIAEALDALLEQAKEGDQVIIYFSGHGDVERKTVSQPGFLLCWDAPARVYMGGGTYSLAYLQEIVTTLSTQNKAKVIVVTDACHAGKLSGSQIGGAQLAAANLARQFANEVKILSCQPGELSLEGEQWGGGRGIFSYHLVDGLFGLADRNADGTVTLGELDRYLEDKVTAEAAPQSQVPMLLGNKTEPLAVVYPAILADLQKHKAGQMPVFTATENRGLEDEVLAGVDTSIREMYRLFNKALDDKAFFEPAGSCADVFYEKLIAEPKLELLHNIMRRNYAAALQDDAQQALNAWLKSDVAIISLYWKYAFGKFSIYPRCLERAAELVGRKHYMYKALMARKHIFDGYLCNLKAGRNPNDSLGKVALAHFDAALELEPNSPHIFFFKSTTFAFNLLKPDSAIVCVEKAVSLAPSWVYPISQLVPILMERYEKYSDAKRMADMAMRFDSNSTFSWYARGMYLRKSGAFDQADRAFQRGATLDSTFSSNYYNMGLSQLDQNNWEGAIYSFKKTLELSPQSASAYRALGIAYEQIGQVETAEAMLRKSIVLDSSFAYALNALGNLYTNTGRFDEAEPLLKKAIELEPTDLNFFLNLSYHYALRGRTKEVDVLNQKIAGMFDNCQVFAGLGVIYTLAGDSTRGFSCIQKAFEKGYDKYPKSYEWLEKQQDLAPLRATPEWKALMKKYFPDHTKD